MYHSQYNIKTPLDKNKKIWRYMDLAKLLAILENKNLYFSRPNKFGDQFEGSITKEAFEHWKTNFPMPPSGFMKIIRERSFINCWHMNEYESEAMWKLYIDSKFGISVQSTISRLIKSLEQEDRFYVFIGEVRYLDYDKDIFDYGNIFNYFLAKRKSFEHEKEIRALVDLGIENPKAKSNTLHFESGIDIQIDVQELIETIYIAPFSPKWYSELIKSLVKRYNYNFPVVQSNLERLPIDI